MFGGELIGMMGGASSPVNTVALLHMDGLNGGTIFTDETGLQTWAATNATTSTAQHKFGTASGHFTGYNGTARKILSSGNINCGAGDFTVEFWVYPAGTENWMFMSGGASFETNIAASELQYVAPNGSDFLFVTPNPTANTWSHVAAVRHSGAFEIYLNGTVCTHISASGVPVAPGANPITIGNNNPSVFQEVYFDEVRFSNIARYTSNFTPPSSPFTVD